MPEQIVVNEVTVYIPVGICWARPQRAQKFRTRPGLGFCTPVKQRALTSTIEGSGDRREASIPLVVGHDLILRSSGGTQITGPPMARGHAPSLSGALMLSGSPRIRSMVASWCGLSISAV
jgi:hypothetical protein